MWAGGEGGRIERLGQMEWLKTEVAGCYLKRWDFSVHLAVGKRWHSHTYSQTYDEEIRQTHQSSALFFFYFFYFVLSIHCGFSRHISLYIHIYVCVCKDGLSFVSVPHRSLWDMADSAGSCGVELRSTESKCGTVRKWSSFPLSQSSFQ